MSVCEESIRAAYGDRSASAADIKQLQSDLRRRARELKARDASLSENDALLAAADDFSKKAELKALAEKRNTLLGMARRMEALDTIRNVYANDPEAGLKAWLVGIQGKRAGARASAANEQLSLHNEYFSGLMADIGKIDGGHDLLAAGTMDREIADVMWRLGTEGADTNGLDPRAIAIGKAIQKWQEAARFNANKAGAWIGKLPGYIVTQSHDAIRISGDRQGWMAMMRERADIGRMMDEQGADSVDELLDGLWENLASGLHHKTAPTGGGGKGLSGMARGVSQERVIHFKSADDWFAYNEAFGGGNLREAVLGGLSKLSRATGLMRVMGPNHADTYTRVVNDLTSALKKTDPAAAGKLDKTAERYRKIYLAELDGSLDVPGNNVLGEWSANIRAIQNMSALGGSFLSSIGDLGVMMVGARYAGGNAFDVVGRGVGSLFRSAPKGERLELLADLGVALESMAGRFTTNRFSVDDGVRGAIGTMQKAFFKYNLQNRWTDAMRSGIAEFLSANLSRRAQTGFDGLPADLRSTLTLYGIDAGKWDIIRKGTLREMDGQKFLTPNALDEVDDAEFAKYLTDRDLPATGREVKRLREEVKRQIRGYFVDQNGYMLLSPDAATRGIMKMGTQKGTAAGEGVRMIMQFKSYMLAFSERIIGRQYQQQGVAGVAKMIAATTLMGYVAMSAKDLAKGKAPRDPTDPKTAIASMVQGGGLGIYGDILFSQVLERRGQDALAQLFGPTVSDANEAIKIMARAAEGRDPTAAGVRFVQSNTPFINLFYTRLALDYMVFWNLQEAVNPGSLARTEREMQERTGQQYLVQPSRDRFQPERVQ